MRARLPAVLAASMLLAGCTASSGESSGGPSPSLTEFRSPAPPESAWGPMAVVHTRGKRGVAWPDIGFKVRGRLHIGGECVKLRGPHRSVLLVFTDTQAQFESGSVPRIVLYPNRGPRHGHGNEDRRVVLTDGDRIQLASTLAPEMSDNIDWVAAPDDSCGDAARFVYDVRKL